MSHKYLSLSALKKKQALSLKRELNASIFGLLPLWGSIKDKVQEVYDQGSEGSCTANAFCGAYRILEPDKSFVPSRQYVYWKERLAEDGNDPTKITDSGADVEDAVKYVSQNGVCSEASWPYDPTKVDVAPPSSCDVEASAHKLGALTAIQVGNNNAIKNAILSGLPVMIAIGVYKSFECALTNETGVVFDPKPINYEDPNDPVDPFMGGHEILIVGFYDIPGFFTVLNSWGTSWGHGGYCYLPYSYVSNPKLTYELCCLSPASSGSNTTSTTTAPTTNSTTTSPTVASSTIASDTTASTTTGATEDQTTDETGDKTAFYETKSKRSKSHHHHSHRKRNIQEIIYVHYICILWFMYCLDK